MKDYYYILGINKNSPISEIKTAYRKLSKKFHPDINPKDTFFESRFKDIQEAYEVLSDRSKRKSYDTKLNEYIKSEDYILKKDKEFKIKEELLKKRGLTFSQRILIKIGSLAIILIFIFLIYFFHIQSKDKKSHYASNLKKLRIETEHVKELNSIDQYENYLESNPESFEAYNNLGNTYDEAGLCNKAIECYTKAVTINPESEQARFNLAREWNIKGNGYYDSEKYLNAIACYESALKYKPDFHWAMDNLSYAYLQLDNEEFYSIDRHDTKVISWKIKAALAGNENAKKWLIENGYDY